MLSTRTTFVLVFAALCLSACSKKAEAPPPAVPAATAPALDDEKVLNIYNWPDYVAEGLIPDFEKATGIKVNYQTFEVNEVLQAKLVAGNTGYDIVVPSSIFVDAQVKAGFYQPLNKAAIPNFANLDAEVLSKLADIDPKHDRVVPWIWGFTTVAINRSKVEKALGGKPLPENAWDLVLNPEYTSKLKSCGIAYLDAPTEIVPVALHYIGKPAFSNDPADHKLAAAVLAKVRKDVRIFSSTMIDDIASGRVCAAIGWSSDINTAARRTKDNGSNEKVEALLPSTGGLIFFDVMAITKDAKHPKNAHAFINFYLDKTQAARQMNEMLAMTGNKAAAELMQPEVRDNKSINVDAENMAKMAPPGNLTNEGRESMATVYTAFRKGR